MCNCICKNDQSVKGISVSNREQIIGRQYDAERSLYNLIGSDVIDCTFAGPADGESVLKEAIDINVKRCSFSLRYPMWHVKGFILEDSQMDELTRAAIWYAENGTIRNCDMNGIKAVRGCSHIDIGDCRISSPEFGWKSKDISLKDSDIVSEYLFLDAKDVTLDHVRMGGKYSFQYVEGLRISDSELDTKDAFWHSKDVVVRDSVVKGEYLGWFSEGLTLINCKIIGTQPLCYCKDLRLVNCTMECTDLAFEYSDVNADVIGRIDSVKNPRSGTIVADEIGDIIRDDPVMECTGKVKIRRS